MPRKVFAYTRIYLLTLLTALVAGCGSEGKGGGKEVDLISEVATKKADLPTGTGPLWPLVAGKSWRTLTIRPNQKNTDSEIRVIGPFRVPDGRSGTLVRSYRGGKPFRVEVIQTDRTGGMRILGLGESEKKLLVFSPAIPYLVTPVKEGEYLQWDGTARIAGQEYVATAFHRVSTVDSVKTPFETIRAYRLDGIISLVNGTQKIDYPAVMWFVPGKGVAQRRLADRGTLALEVITKFTN
ncbi:MAG: hypothetical protein H7145_04790 [Akkermansiaceae bacterium]|nr:hypothetical protein [Armatimonadota bacterium]